MADTKLLQIKNSTQEELKIKEEKTGVEGAAVPVESERRLLIGRWVERMM